VVGGVGLPQLVGAQRQHPRAVDRHVPVADHDHSLAAQVELAVGVVGMAVVPADEGRRRLRAPQVLPGDPEPPVRRRADRVDHRVVALEQVRAVQVAAELDASEEPEALLRRRLLEDAHDRLDLRVVRSDPRAHEPERGRQAVDEVYAHGALGGEQVPGGVEASRPCADDGDAEFLIRVQG